MREHPSLDADLNEGGEDGCSDLSEERELRRDLSIVSEFLITREDLIKEQKGGRRVSKLESVAHASRSFSELTKACAIEIWPVVLNIIIATGFPLQM